MSKYNALIDIAVKRVSDRTKQEKKLELRLMADIVDAPDEVRASFIRNIIHIANNTSNPYSVRERAIWLLRIGSESLRLRQFPWYADSLINLLLNEMRCCTYSSTEASIEQYEAAYRYRDQASNYLIAIISALRAVESKEGLRLAKVIAKHYRTVADDIEDTVAAWKSKPAP
jgi:hypothetical protein